MKEKGHGDGPVRSFRESFGIPKFPRHQSSRRALSPFCLFHFAPTRPEIRGHCVTSADKYVRIANARGSTKHAERGGSRIETGREFRAASSKIYSRCADEGRGMLGIGGREGNTRRADGVNRSIERISGPLRYGNFGEDL